MNRRILAIAALALPLLAITGVALWQQGFIAIFEVALQDAASAQVFTDLAVALVLLTGFIRNDARERGLAWWPWLLATPALGSIAPLGYMVWREVHGTRDGVTAAAR